MVESTPEKPVVGANKGADAAEAEDEGAAPAVAVAETSNTSESSPLSDEPKPSKSNGQSNNFWQSLQGIIFWRSGSVKNESNEMVTPAVVSSESLNGTAKQSTSNKESASAGKDASSAKNTNATNENDDRQNRNMLLLGEAIIISCLLCINIASAYFIYEEHASHAMFQEQHLSEMKKIQAEITKNREVEAVLASSVKVLIDQSTKERVQHKIGNITMYDFPMAAKEKVEQTREDKNDWLEGLRILSVEKHLGLDELDKKLMDVRVYGAKEEIQALRENKNEASLCNQD